MVDRCSAQITEVGEDGDGWVGEGGDQMVKPRSEGAAVGLLYDGREVVVEDEVDEDVEEKDDEEWMKTTRRDEGRLFSGGVGSMLTHYIMGNIGKKNTSSRNKRRR